MGRKVLLIFRNPLQHGACFLDLFIEFGQKKFADRHVLSLHGLIYRALSLEDDFCNSMRCAAAVTDSVYLLERGAVLGGEGAELSG
jgi:hypothetical protein